MENSSSNNEPTSLKQSLDNLTIVRLLEELRAEIEFIKDELHINAAGPCSHCGRKWFTSSQTGRVTACNVCNDILCPTHMRPRCGSCGWRSCNKHWHVCEYCHSSGGSCYNCLKTCSLCNLVYCYASNFCCNEAGCDNCPKCYPVKCYNSNVYCSEHYDSEITFTQNITL